VLDIEKNAYVKGERIQVIIMISNRDVVYIVAQWPKDLMIGQKKSRRQQV